MKAVIYRQYGSPDVLHVAEVAKPVPRPNEVLVKIHATTVTIGDVIMRSFNLPTPRWQWLFARLYLGVFGPKRSILGMDLAGTVEVVGANVTRFKQGDQVFASTVDMNFGGYAEYKAVPKDGVLALKPSNLSYEDAAAVPGAGMTALHVLKKGAIAAGQKVLVYGASGAVGTNAVQIAKSLGAVVTGVSSAANLELVKSLGADRVIDYRQVDFTRQPERYDVVFDAVAKIDPAQGKKALKPGGRYLHVHRDSDGGNTLDGLMTLKALVEAGKVKPVIDRRYALDQIPDAHRYVETGRKRGNVVVTV